MTPSYHDRVGSGYESDKSFRKDAGVRFYDSPFQFG